MAEASASSSRNTCSAPKEWTVKVTRTEASKGREFDGASTLIDLRKTREDDWKHTIFHRYSMMQPGDVMELLAGHRPAEIEGLFASRFEGTHTWAYKKEGPAEWVVHVQKLDVRAQDSAEVTVVSEFDVRPHHPAKRHDMVFDAFDELEAGEAFEFTNDHDPKPLYYQIEAESQQRFDWEYLEDGPEVWRVKVTKYGA